MILIFIGIGIVIGIVITLFGLRVKDFIIGLIPSPKGKEETI